MTALLRAAEQAMWRTFAAEDAVGYGIGLFLAVLAISVLAVVLSLLAEIWRDRK